MLGVIARGMALGHIEYYLTKPWRPRQHLLYAVIGEALVAWTRVNWPGFELVRIVGDRWHPVSHELRNGAGTQQRPVRVLRPRLPEGAGLLAELDRVSDHPVIFLAGGWCLPDTQADIAEAVGAQVRPEARLLRPGCRRCRAGGAERAVYGASEGLSTLVLESVAMGGQAGTSSRIRNFLGFPAGISGGELAERAFQQAWMFGAEFVFINGAAGLSARGDGLVVTLADGGQVSARAVVLATGVTYRQLDTPGIAGLVDVEEVGGEHGRGLRVQELPPRGVGVPFGCRGDLQGFEDPADRGGADPVAELEQFALHPLVAPAVVLSGEPFDERGDLALTGGRPIRRG